MFHVERSDGAGNWTVMLVSPDPIGICDLHGQAETYPPSTPPGFKSAFSGKPGWQARVRYKDTVLDVYEWEKIPLNPLDPDTELAWGWKHLAHFHREIPGLYPLSFTG